MDQGTASSDLIPGFGALIGRIKQAVADGVGRDTPRLGGLSVLLWGYLSRCLLRLAALETRRIAGTLRPLAPTRRRVDRRRPDETATQYGTTTQYATTTPGATATPGGTACSARIPYGPVLLRFNAAHLAWALERLIETPEMLALLAAAPQAGRVLRPLWRMLSTDPPPPPLRLPPRARTRRARPTIPPDANPGEAPRRARRLRKTARGAWWNGAPASPSMRPCSGRIAPTPRPPPPDW